jgi:hypothetical protein
MPVDRKDPPKRLPQTDCGTSLGSAGWPAQASIASAVGSTADGTLDGCPRPTRIGRFVERPHRGGSDATSADRWPEVMPLRLRLRYGGTAVDRSAGLVAPHWRSGHRVARRVTHQRRRLAPCHIDVYNDAVEGSNSWAAPRPGNRREHVGAREFTSVVPTSKVVSRASPAIGTSRSRRRAQNAGVRTPGGGRRPEDRTRSSTRAFRGHGSSIRIATMPGRPERGPVAVTTATGTTVPEPPRPPSPVGGTTVTAGVRSSAWRDPTRRSVPPRRWFELAQATDALGRDGVLVACDDGDLALSLRRMSSSVTAASSAQ